MRCKARQGEVAGENGERRSTMGMARPFSMKVLVGATAAGVRYVPPPPVSMRHLDRQNSRKLSLTIAWHSSNRFGGRGLQPQSRNANLAFGCAQIGAIDLALLGQ